MGDTMNDSPADDGYIGQLAPGVRLSATLQSPGEAEHFTFDAQAGEVCRFELQSGAASFALSGFSFTDADGHSVPSGMQMASDCTLSCWVAPSVSGKFVLTVSASHYSTGQSYSVEEEAPLYDDVGNDPAHAAVLALGVTVARALEVPTDQDVYKLHVEAGNTYRIDALPIGSNPYGHDAFSLSAVDGAGGSINLRPLPNDASSGSRLFEAAATGDYYFTVAHSVSNDYQSSAYALSTWSYGADDYPDTAPAKVELPVNGKLQGSIDYPDDSDSFKVHLEAGRSYVFDLQGVLSGGGSIDATTAGLSLYSPQLDTRGAQALSGGEARLLYVAAATGDYYINVHGDGNHLGSYTVVATQTSGDLTPPALASSASVDAPGLTGKLTLSFSESIVAGATSGITLMDSAGHAVAPHGAANYQVTAAGNQLLLDFHSYLAPGASYTLTLPAASVLDLAGNQLAAPVTISISTPAAAAQGGAGDDLLLGQGNGLQIDGGAGIDTVHYASPASNLDIVRGAGQTTVQLHGAAAPDVLTGIERIQLPDEALALDIDGNAGQAYRLYQAAFDRIPDAAGLGFWISALDHGTSLQTVAHGFTASAEFQSLYGASISDAQYVSQLYHNVLHRDGEPSGAAFWLDVLQHGHTRDEVLTAFSESPENQAAVIGSIQHGVIYTPFG